MRNWTIEDFDSRIAALEILNNVAYVGFEGFDQLLAVNIQGALVVKQRVQIRNKLYWLFYND